MKAKTSKLVVYDDSLLMTQDSWDKFGNLLIDELRKNLLDELMIKYQPIYVLASNYRIAKSIFDHYFLITGLARRIDLRYIDHIEKIYGLRNVYIVVSNERYPSSSFWDRLFWIREQSGYRQFEVVNEQDLEKEQVREKVSRQRPQEPKGK